MCYEFWHEEKTQVEEKAARQKTQELLGKAGSARPAPQDEPLSAELEPEKETSPA